MADQGKRKIGDMPPSKVFGSLCITFALGIGWLACSLWSSYQSSHGQLSSQAIREKNNSYPLINPLLACDFNDQRTVGENMDLKNIISGEIDKAIKNQKIDNASVYLRDYGNNRWVGVNQNERYSEASLGKVPILVSYLKLAEDKQPDLLNQKILYPSGVQNLNSAQEIHPASDLKSGQSYTIAELLERMIVYSDNNSADLLLRNLPPGYLENIYEDLNIPVSATSTASNLPDFITAKSYSLFFRILYNSTYLSRAESESALDLLSKTDFKQGLAAGVPEGVQVAHKFGLLSRTSDGTLNTAVNFRELHDCGIVYASNHPYLICVMTKTSHDLDGAEETIANISRDVYQYIDVNK